MPRSAPLASASLTVCLARSGPIEMATASPPCFSLRRSASSSAKLSGSFVSKLISVSRIHEPLASITSGASFAGTCFTQTPIFNDSLLQTFYRRLAPQNQNRSAAIPEFEYQRRVSAAKAERIRERVLHVRLARLIRNVIEIARRIGIFVIDGRWQHLIAQRQNADACFQAACAAQHVPGH